MSGKDLKLYIRIFYKKVYFLMISHLSKVAYSAHQLIKKESDLAIISLISISIKPSSLTSRALIFKSVQFVSQIAPAPQPFFSGLSKVNETQRR